MKKEVPLKLLVVGATGSIGKHVIDVALEDGHSVRALVRKGSTGRRFPRGVAVVHGDLTRRETLAEAVNDIEAVIFTHGSHGGQRDAEAVDYGAVRNVLLALGGRKVRIALMTTIGSTDRRGAHDWKRRGEWLVRASGLPYTIVRPAWFDYNAPDELKLLMLQGDKPLVGSPSDGVISRRQLGEVLVRSLHSDAALRKTFELHATKGAAQENFEELFAALDADVPGSLHGVRDIQNMPVDKEPVLIRQDIEAIKLLANITSSA